MSVGRILGHTSIMLKTFELPRLLSMSGDVNLKRTLYGAQQAYWKKSLFYEKDNIHSNEAYLMLHRKCIFFGSFGEI